MKHSLAKVYPKRFSGDRCCRGKWKPGVVGQVRKTAPDRRKAGNIWSCRTCCHGRPSIVGLPPHRPPPVSAAAPPVRGRVGGCLVSRRQHHCMLLLLLLLLAVAVVVQSRRHRYIAGQLVGHSASFAVPDTPVKRWPLPQQQAITDTARRQQRYTVSSSTGKLFSLYYNSNPDTEPLVILRMNGTYKPDKQKT